MIRVVGVVTGRGRSMDDTMTRDAAPMGAGWGWLLAYGLLSLILGVAAFLWPFSATIAATFIIAAFFFAAGIDSIASGLFGGIREWRGSPLALGAVPLTFGPTLSHHPLTGPRPQVRTVGTKCVLTVTLR